MCSGWVSLDRSGTLPGNGELTAPDVDVAFNRKLVVPAAGSAEIDLYLTFGPDLAVSRRVSTSACPERRVLVRSDRAGACQWLASGAPPHLRTTA